MISLTNKTHNYFFIIILKNNITFQKHKKYIYIYEMQSASKRIIQFQSALGQAIHL